ncbi:MAG: hypothetical protein HY910_13580 [Desulfarculus sp.]|nr:hypothetical protein [Desulfarculus sp.]
MDRLTISSAGGMAADYQGLGNLRRRNPQAEEEFSLPGQAAQTEAKPEAPAQAQDTADTPGKATASAVAKDLGQDLAPLSRPEAREVLQGLGPVIAQTHPWKLAEIQAVAERSLIPTAYV